jgi:hypothetical protein
MLKKILNKIRIILFGSYLELKEPEIIIEELKKKDMEILTAQIRENTQAIYSLSNKIKDLQELVVANNTILECIQNEFDSLTEDEIVINTDNKVNAINYNKKDIN